LGNFSWTSAKCWKTEGVESVEINRKQYKVTVQGFVEPHKVVKWVQATGKKAEIWPYIPYNLVAHPYATHTDKKAPPGYVRKVVASYGGGAGPGAQEERLTTMFSDDNPSYPTPAPSCETLIRWGRSVWTVHDAKTISRDH
jgi:hypothetical protein